VNALITGDTGFLGKYIYKALLQKGYRIFGISRSSSGLDISGEFVLPSEFYDIVVHCAGKAHSYPKLNKEIEEFYLVNYIGTINLCSALENCKIKQFIFISTVAIYGEFGSGYTETSNPVLSTPYAESKFMAEQFLVKWGEQRKIPVLIFRLPLVVGTNPPGNLGKMLNAIKRGNYISVDKGKCKRSVVLAEDVALLITSLKFPRNGLYNLSDSCDIQFSDFEQYLYSLFGKKKVVNIDKRFLALISWIGDFIPMFPINTKLLNKLTKDFIISSDLAKEELNWNPKIVKDNLNLYYDISNGNSSSR
jgi:nucleoside-diphosphate-sugar epimerase